MSYNIAIDLGNSLTKVYLFEGNTLAGSFRYSTLTAESLDELFARYDICDAIIASVRSDDRHIAGYLQSRCRKVIVLDYTTPLPIKLHYDTPDTLGRDRIAAAVGAATEAPSVNLLVIDAGTAITLDVVDAQGNYLGGNISPGMSIRFKALNNYTQKLPVVEAEGEVPEIGHNTVTAIRAGVVRGVLMEIEGYISLISHKIGDLTVYITGGDAKYLAKQIKNRIFEDENLLAKGLNRILLYNNENI